MIASGQASVTAKANTTLGAYTVTASAASVTTAASFALTNVPAAAASVAVLSGSGQTPTVATGFAQPLVAVVKDAFGNPVPGVTVTFNAPAAGASATLTGSPAVTDADGQASVTATAGTVAGIYTVSASVAGVTTAAAFTLTNTEALSLRLTTHHDVVNEVDRLTSLREAIAYANSHPGPDTITFDPAVFGKARRMIKLIGGPLVLTDPATTTILGPGAKRLTISGGGQHRVIDVQRGSLALSGLTIAKGRADNGGGIRNQGGRLALTRVVLMGSKARLLGGGLYNDGIATLSGVTITGNAASLGGGLVNLGRLSVGELTVRRNVARFASGLFNRGKMMIRRPLVQPKLSTQRADWWRCPRQKNLDW